MKHPNILAAFVLFSTTLSIVAQDEPPLRLSEPFEAVVADLEAYIPGRMQESIVPGLAVALIRDNRVVWSSGFGVANEITGRAVTSETVFEAASISKVVTAYAALRLVEQGRLALDEPVSAFLSEPWLPPSEFSGKITLRHLVSHSSGLTENLVPTVDKSIIFDPGSEFLYTGIGFMYLQEAIEQVTGKPLEEAARELVFGPLGMSSSSFLNPAGEMSRMANGHLRTTLPLLMFVVPYLFVLFAIALVGVPTLYFTSGKWRPSGKLVKRVCLVTFVLTLVVLQLSFLGNLPNFLFLVGLCGVVFAIAFVLALLLGRLVRSYLPERWQGRRLESLLKLVWIVVSLVVLVRVSGLLTTPVPRVPSPRASAVGSLRTTAGDLALLLIELAEARYVSGEMAEEIRTPQIPAGEGFSWGLGIGIQHSSQGYALWQNAQTFGFRGLMVAYPEQGTGVVVLTNSDDGYPVACNVAARALGGRARWEYF